MPLAILFGLVVGFFVWTHLFVIIAPILAIVNFFCGRFFVAAVLMSIGLWCGTWVWMDDPTPFVVGREQYLVLLLGGLILEIVKYGVVLYLNNREVEQEEAEPEADYEVDLRGQNEYGLMDLMNDIRERGINVNVNVVVHDDDKEPHGESRMKNVTPIRRRLAR
jgi:uncharacterized membrane protein YagU involved in acid resistance